CRGGRCAGGRYGTPGHLCPPRRCSAQRSAKADAPSSPLAPDVDSERFSLEPATALPYLKAGLDVQEVRWAGQISAAGRIGGDGADVEVLNRPDGAVHHVGDPIVGRPAARMA